MQSLTINSGIPMAFLSYHPPWSVHCLSSSMGGWAPYTSSAGMFRSSTKITYFLPSGGPKTPLHLQCRTLLRASRGNCGYRYRYAYIRDKRHPCALQCRALLMLRACRGHYSCGYTYAYARVKDGLMLAVLRACRGYIQACLC